MAATIRECPTCKTNQAVVSVEQVENGKKFNLQCGHFVRDLAIVIKENMNISDSVSVMIIKNPVGEIERAIQDRDFFKAVTYGCTTFEHFGKLLSYRTFARSEDQSAGIESSI